MATIEQMDPMTFLIMLPFLPFYLLANMFSQGTASQANARMSGFPNLPSLPSLPAEQPRHEVFNYAEKEQSYVSPTSHNKTVIVNLTYDRQDRITKIEKHVVP